MSQRSDHGPEASTEDSPRTAVPTAPEGFEAHVRESGALWLVRVRGEIDLASAPKLEAVLDEAIAAQPARVMVELESVSFLDSTGLRVLVEAQRRLQQGGGTFVIDGMSETVRRVLEVSGLLAELADSDDEGA
jgi:anti-sigma B factor antagonist